ncbi:MAG: aminoacyl-tRNA hydrolase [Candidatus Paceibacterota bacterium]
MAVPTYMEQGTYHIIGLGNPDEKYKNTPHNVGFQILDIFRSAWNGTDWKRDNVLNALTSIGASGDATIALLKPETYMNRSGETVRALLKQVPPAELTEQLIVVHDDIDLPQGRIKITRRGGAGGHHGVESIARALETDVFIRIKVGIAPNDENGEIRKPKGERTVTEYVLRPNPHFSARVADTIGPMLVEAVALLVRDGVDRAMSRYNAPPDPALDSSADTVNEAPPEPE